MGEVWRVACLLHKHVYGLEFWPGEVIPYVGEMCIRDSLYPRRMDEHPPRIGSSGIERGNWMHHPFVVQTNPLCVYYVSLPKQTPVAKGPSPVCGASAQRVVARSNPTAWRRFNFSLIRAQ